MPVDYCVCVLPLLILVAAIPAAVGGRYRRTWRWIAGGLLGGFLLIYFVPGWVLWVFAQAGYRDAQYSLGNYYNTRLGYNWPDTEARDKWWVEAAKQGHPEAMLQVGWKSMSLSLRKVPALMGVSYPCQPIQVIVVAA